MIRSMEEISQLEQDLGHVWEAQVHEDNPQRPCSATLPTWRHSNAIGLPPFFGLSRHLGLLCFPSSAQLPASGLWLDLDPRLDAPLLKSPGILSMLRLTVCI